MSTENTVTLEIKILNIKLTGIGKQRMKLKVFLLRHTAKQYGTFGVTAK